MQHLEVSVAVHIHIYFIRRLKVNSSGTSAQASLSGGALQQFYRFGLHYSRNLQGELRRRIVWLVTYVSQYE